MSISHFQKQTPNHNPPKCGKMSCGPLSVSPSSSSSSSSSSSATSWAFPSPGRRCHVRRKAGLGRVVAPRVDGWGPIPSPGPFKGAVPDIFCSWPQPSRGGLSLGISLFGEFFSFINSTNFTWFRSPSVKHSNKRPIKICL